MRFEEEHTCIKDDGSTPNRKCRACEEEVKNDRAEVLHLWRRLNVLAETDEVAAAIVNAYRTTRRM